MTKQELLNQYIVAIKEAGVTFENESAPQAARDAADKVIKSLYKKVVVLKSQIQEEMKIEFLKKLNKANNVTEVLGLVDSTL